MKKHNDKRPMISRNVINTLSLVTLVLLICMTEVNVSAQEIERRITGKYVQTAALSNTLSQPKGNENHVFKGIMESDTLSAETYNIQGVIYLRNGQYDLALSEFSKALEINTKYAEAYNNRGIIYSNKSQYDFALSDFNKALEIKPEYATAYYNRGITYAIKGRFDLALSDFNRTLEINPLDAAAYDSRGRVHVELACSDWKQACNLGNCDHLKEATRVGLCAETIGNSPLSP